MKKIILVLILLMPLAMFAQTKKVCTPSRAKVTTKKATTAPKSTVKNVEAKSDAPPVNKTGGMPKMTFAKKTHDFGKIKTGDKPEFTFNFTNTGNAPLDIDIVSGCDCTELDWTRTTVEPGQKGFIKAIYNSNKAEPEDHKKQLTKDITIVMKQIHTQNGSPLFEEVRFNVFIVD